MSKEACCLVVDVAHTAGRSDNMGVSPIDVVKYAVKRLLQQYFLFGKTNDIMGIVLVGTEDTKNPIYDEDGQCANITVFKPVEKPVVDWIATVDEEIQESGASGDITDGLVVGMREIMDTIEKRKYSRRLVVITDGSSAFSMGHFDKYVEILKLENYELEVLGLNFESDEMASQMRQTIQDKVAAATGQAAGGDGEEAKGGDDGDSHADDTRSRAKRPVGAAGAGGMADAAGNSLVMVNAAGYGSSVAQQEAETHVLDKRSLETRRTTASLRTEMRLRLLAEHCGGTVYSAGALDALMNGMQTRSVGGVSKMRACLELGNASTENIAIWTYAKTSMVSLPSLSKSSALAEEAGGAYSTVRMSRAYINAAKGEAVEVGAEDHIKAYKYGSELVPFTDADEALLKMDWKKGMQVLAFVSKDKVGREHFLGSTDIVIAEPDNPEAAVAVSALVRAMIQRQVVALTKYVKRANASPLLGALIPHVEPNIECFYWIQLPFYEDIRPYAFASLRHSLANIPDVARKIESAHRLVQTMDLSEAASTPSGFATEAYQPRATFHPALQRFYKTLEQRALDSEAKVVLEEETEQMVSPIKSLMEHADKALREFRAAFPTVKAEVAEPGKERRKHHWRDFLDKDYTVDHGLLRAKQDVVDLSLDKLAVKGGASSSSTASSSSSTSSAAAATADAGSSGLVLDSVKQEFGAARVTSVSTSDPVGDLVVLVAQAKRIGDSAMLMSALQQAAEVSKVLVRTSFGDSLFDKAMSVLAALRRTCVQQEEPVLYNECLSAVRGEFEFKKPDYWDLLVQHADELKPISFAETVSSNVSVSDAAAFFSAPAPASVAPAPQPAAPPVDDDFGDLE